MDEDSSGQRYRQWTEIIAYSGLTNYERIDAEIEKEIVSNMDKHCYSCSANTKGRIVTFAKDITKAIKFQD